MRNRQSAKSARPRRWQCALAMLLAATMLAAAGCGRKKTKKQPPVVSYVVLKPQTVKVQRSYVGHTEALLTVDVRPRASGYLKRFYFAEGQVVRKGQLLFEIDPSPYKVALEGAEAQLARADSNIAQAKAQLDRAEQDVTRYAPLAKIHAIPAEMYIDAMDMERQRRAALMQARAMRKVEAAAAANARLNLGYTAIRAPITGVIGWRKVDPGNLVSPQSPTPLATISSSRPIRVDFFIDDADYLKYIAPRIRELKKQGQDGLDWKLKLADGESYPGKGRFYALGRAVDPATDTIEMQLLFRNPHNVLRPGEYASVSANLEERDNAILVPVDAVQTLQGNKTVYVVEGDKARLKSIEATQRAGNSWIATGGVKAGDKLIVAGQQKVKPGERVEAKRENAGAPGDRLGGGAR